MTHRRLVAALAVVAILGCEQASQDLPFEPGSTEAVTRTLGPQGGVISTPAGLSLDFAAGSLDRATEVTLIPRAGTDVGVSVSGDVVPGTVFDVSPAGETLGESARLSLKVPEETLAESDPRALTAVLVAGSERRYLSVASVDLRAGILKTDLPRLGTVALRISDDVVQVDPVGSVVGAASRASALGADQVVGVTGGSAASVGRTAHFSMSCGDEGEQTCVASSDLAITLTEDLYDAVGGCVQFIDPVVRMDLTLEQTDSDATRGRAEGSMVFSGTVRFETGSDGSVCGSGSGSVQSLAVSDTVSLGNSERDWTTFSFDPTAGTITVWETDSGVETFDCDCGSDIYEASEIWLGQASEPVTYEGLSGEVTWAVRLRK